MSRGSSGLAMLERMPRSWSIFTWTEQGKLASVLVFHIKDRAVRYWTEAGRQMGDRPGAVVLYRPDSRPFLKKHRGFAVPAMRPADRVRLVELEDDGAVLLESAPRVPAELERRVLAGTAVRA